MVESKHQWKAWLYLAPAIVLLLIVIFWIISVNRLTLTAIHANCCGIQRIQHTLGDAHMHLTGNGNRAIQRDLSATPTDLNSVHSNVLLIGRFFAISSILQFHPKRNHKFQFVELIALWAMAPFGCRRTDCHGSSTLAMTNFSIQ